MVWKDYYGLIKIVNQYLLGEFKEKIMGFFEDLMKKEHIKKHPLFAKQFLPGIRETIQRHAQAVEQEEQDDGDLPDLNDMFSQIDTKNVVQSSKKLPDMIRAAVIVTEDALAQFDFPIPPKVTYGDTRNIKYSKVYTDDVVSGQVILNCKIATVTGVRQHMDIPVNIAAGSVIPPSVVLHEGRERVIAQSTFDAIIRRNTSYALPQIRDMFDPPLTREELKYEVAARNEIGWQPKTYFNPTVHKTHSRKAAGEGTYIIDLPEMKGKEFPGYSEAYDALSEFYWVEAEERAYRYPDTISDVDPGEIIEELADAYIKRFDGEKPPRIFSKQAQDAITLQFISDVSGQNPEASAQYADLVSTMNPDHMNMDDLSIALEEDFAASYPNVNFTDAAAQILSESVYEQYGDWKDRMQTAAKQARTKPIPGNYSLVVEKMQEAEEDGKDSFPRPWQHVLREYVLEVCATVDKDEWEPHLINDGFCINPYGMNRGRNKKAQAGILGPPIQEPGSQQYFQVELSGYPHKDAQEELEEDYELAPPRTYDGTKTPMEPGDGIKFQGGDGPIRGTIVEVDPDSDYLIVKSKGLEYRVNCEDISVLPSTHNKMWKEQKKSQYYNDNTGTTLSEELLEKIADALHFFQEEAPRPTRKEVVAFIEDNGVDIIDDLLSAYQEESMRQEYSSPPERGF